MTTLEGPEQGRWKALQQCGSACTPWCRMLTDVWTASDTKRGGTCWALSWGGGGGLRQIREMGSSIQSPSLWPVIEKTIMSAYADHADHCITHLVLVFTTRPHFLYAPLHTTARRGGCLLVPHVYMKSIPLTL